MARSKPKPPRDGDKRFDHWFNDWNRHTTDLHRALRLGVRHLRDAHEAAYHVAATYLQMLKHWHNELLAECARQQLTIDQWLDQGLAPFEALFHEDRKTLFAAIESGMTAKQFAKTGATVYLVELRPKKQSRRKGAAAASASPADALPEPTDDMPVEQQRARWKELAVARGQTISGLRTEVHSLKARLRDALGLIETLKRQVKRLMKCCNLAA